MHHDDVNEDQDDTSARPALIALLVIAGLGLAAAAAVGCRDAPAERVASKKPAADQAPATTALVEGWACDAVETCFGLQLGRTQSFERRVGGRVETELRTLADRVPVEGESPAHAVFVETDGTRRFATTDHALALELRGQLLEALRFPARPGDAFTIDDGAGNQVTMTVRATVASRTTPAGTFGPCLVHEARFENPEQPESAGLRIETTLCQGIGEVARSIALPALPLPVEFTLLDPGELAVVPAATDPTPTPSAQRPGAAGRRERR